MTLCSPREGNIFHYSALLLPTEICIENVRINKEYNLIFKQEYKTMIHGNSSDPVLIKKIKVKIWHLRDEIEATIRARLANNPDEPIPSIEDLILEYKANPAVASTAKGLEIVPDEASESPEEVKESKETEEETTETTESADDSESQAETNPSTIKQRIPELKVDKIILGTAVLAELDIDHLYLFTNKQFVAGQSIVIEFLVPKRFVVNADIIFSRAYNMKSRIISDVKLPFRTGLQFTFLKEGERTLLRNFIVSVEPNIPEPAVDMAKVANKSDDDFDELDDFDL